MVKLNELEFFTTLHFRTKPTTAEFENNNSVEIVDGLPIGTIMFSGDAMLADLRVPGDSEFSNYLLNGSALLVDQDPVWQDLDIWMKHYLYLKATSSELDTNT